MYIKYEHNTSSSTGTLASRVDSRVDVDGRTDIRTDGKFDSCTAPRSRRCYTNIQIKTTRHPSDVMLLSFVIQDTRFVQKTKI